MNIPELDIFLYGDQIRTPTEQEEMISSISILEITELNLQSQLQDAQFKTVSKGFMDILNLQTHIRHHGITKDVFLLHEDILGKIYSHGCESFPTIGNSSDIISEVGQEGLGDVASSIWEFLKKVVEKIIELISRFFEWIGSFFSSETARSNRIFEEAHKQYQQQQSGGSSNAGSSNNSSSNSSNGSSSSGNSNQSSNQQSNTGGNNSQSSDRDSRTFKVWEQGALQKYIGPAIQTPCEIVNNRYPSYNLKGEFHSTIYQECMNFKIDPVIAQALEVMKKTVKPQRDHEVNRPAALVLAIREYDRIREYLIANLKKFLGPCEKGAALARLLKEKFVEANKWEEVVKRNPDRERLKTLGDIVAVVKKGLKDMTENLSNAKSLGVGGAKNNATLLREVDDLVNAIVAP